MCQHRPRIEKAQAHIQSAGCRYLASRSYPAGGQLTDVTDRKDAVKQETHMSTVRAILAH